jgi:hypothetical protein
MAKKILTISKEDYLWSLQSPAVKARMGMRKLPKNYKKPKMDFKPISWNKHKKIQEKWIRENKPLPLKTDANTLSPMVHGYAEKRFSKEKLEKAMKIITQQPGPQPTSRKSVVDEAAKLYAKKYYPSNQKSYTAGFKKAVELFEMEKEIQAQVERIKNAIAQCGEHKLFVKND